MALGEIMAHFLITSLGPLSSKAAREILLALPPNEIGNRQTVKSFGHIIRELRRERKRLSSGPLSCFNLLSRHIIPTKGDICDLPSSPEGAIKVDEIRRDLRVAVGKIIFALQQLGLCRDDIQEVDRTLRVTLPGGLQSGLIFSDGPGDVAAPYLRFAIGRDGVVDLLPGPTRFSER